MGPIGKGLVIKKCWIELILSGQKTWEMRSYRLTYRGWIGLVQKKTEFVYGIAHLVDVGCPLSISELIDTIDKHQIDKATILSDGFNYKIPWIFKDIQRLGQPVRIRKRNGPGIYPLDQAESDAILTQVGTSTR